MPVSLDGLRSALPSLDAGDPNGAVALRRRQEEALLAMKRSLEMEKQFPGKVFSGGSNAEAVDDQMHLDEDNQFGTTAQAENDAAEKTYQQGVTYNRPDVTQQRQEAEALKKFLAVEPAKVAAEGNLAVAKQAGENQLNLEKTQQEPALKFLSGDHGAGALKAAGTPGSMKPAFDTKGRMSLSMVPTPPQELSQQHAAQIGLEQAGNLRKIVDTLDAHGAIGPVAGRMSSALVGSGFDSYLMNPESARAFNEFKNQVSLAKSNMAMVHGGARGGSNIGMAERFDKLMNPNQSAAGLKGSIDTFERWLTRYANAASSADLDAADAEFGIGTAPGAPAQGADLGADWGR